MLTQRVALILNFTGNAYHWGCHGTSAEIHRSVAELGHQVNWLDVRTTHALSPTPRDWDEMRSAGFRDAFFRRNPGVLHALTDADVVVVNGEGTLHGCHRAPMNLLALMHLASAALGKRVHLVNHSIYPGGGDQQAPEADDLYRNVILPLASVVPREPVSREVLRRLGREVPQGFDCLPRFLRRHRVRSLSDPRGPIVVSGGVNLPHQAAARIMAGVARHAATGRRVLFLTGAKGSPAGEDATIYHWMATRMPALEWVNSRNMAEWLLAISSASCLVSGRFHHTIAAATLGTPVIVFPSNTPKVPAMCSMFGLSPPIPYDDPDLTGRVAEGVHEALQGRAGLVSREKMDEILAAGARNFEGL
jgi:polysaccharide pyruvyl transferase WcaK-like protein